MVYDGWPPANTGPDPRNGRAGRSARTSPPPPPSRDAGRRQNWCRVTRPNATAADALAARYGRSSDARRWRGVAVIAVAALALLVWVVWAAFGQLKHHDVGGLVESFEVRSPHEVS